ncbi:MAG: thiolase family protein [Betaproteobacteria bacterium]
MDIVVVDGVRSAIGKFGGGFKDLPASDLGAKVIAEAVRRAQVDPELVDDVVMGCVGQVAEDAFIARRCALKAGLPVKGNAYAVNRLCGSGLQAINTAAQSILAGEAEVCVAGGVENMSRLPFYVRDARWGYRLGHGQFEDGVITALSDPFGGYPMGMTAEIVAERFKVSRADQDEFALLSQQRAAAAIQSGRFKDEILPIEVTSGKTTTVVETDEHPRPDTTLEKLAKLRPAFKADGTVTAGNSSGINDAAAAVVLMSAEKAKALGLRPKLRVMAQGLAGVEPEIMGFAPALAVRKVLAKTGLTLDQIDLIELNEAFAAQSVAVIRDLGLDLEKVNVNGGAIALGHPIGATGAILTVKLMHELAKRGGRYGLATLCIGGGQGIATIFENLQQ